MEMAKSSTKKSVRYRQSPVITFLVVAAVIFICVTSIVRATSLHTKSKQLAETEKTMELKVEEAKQVLYFFYYNISSVKNLVFLSGF